MSILSTYVLAILLFAACPLPLFASAEDKPLVSIPLNNSENSSDGSVAPPMIYAGMLSQALECEDERCEASILEDLKENFDDSLGDFYELFLKTELFKYELESELINKLKGFRVLEEMLRNAHYNEAADYINGKLKTPLRNICVGIAKNEDGDFSRCWNQTEPGCSLKCMDKSIYNLVNSVKNYENRTALLEALSENSQDVYEATQSACAVDNRIDSLKKPLVDNSSQRLCGILTSKLVLHGLSGKSTFFAGNEPNSGSEYSCKGVRLAIDKSSGKWGPDPDLPMLNYVVFKNGSVYRLQANDFLDLQKAVKEYEKKQKNQGTK